MNSTLSRRSLLQGTTGLLVAAGLATGTAATASAATPFATLTPSTATSDDVRAAAYFLRAHGKIGYSAGIPSSWNSTFSNALASFQSSVRLPQTSQIDLATLNALIYPVSYGQNSPSGITAVQYLLHKHGYVVTSAGLNGSYGPQTDRDIRAFQVGQMLPMSSTATLDTIRALFAPATIGPLFAVRQAGTGAAQSTNCGPTSMLACLLYLRINPPGWDGTNASRVAAINYLRYTAMGLPNTSDSRYAANPFVKDRNSVGTEFPDFQVGFSKFGLTARQGGVSDNIAMAQQGRPSICGGDAKQLPWSNLAGHWSHWIAVLGFDGTHYRVVDPDSPATNDVVHLLTESQLRAYAATNPGYGTTTSPKYSRMAPPSLNSILI